MSIAYRQALLTGSHEGYCFRQIALPDAHTTSGVISLYASADVVASDIEGSVEYQALIVAAAGKPERAMGNSVIPAEPPVWAEVKDLASSLLSDPPHMSIIVHLIKADTHLKGFKGLCDSLEMLNEKLINSWDSLLPGPDNDDPNDPFYERVNYLKEISEDRSFLNSINAIKLVDVRGIGAFSIRDIDVANGQISASEEEQARCQDALVRAAFNEAELSQLQLTAQSMSRVIELCGNIQSCFDNHAGADHSLNIAPLRQCVQDSEQQFISYTSSRLEELADADESAAVDDSFQQSVESNVEKTPALSSANPLSDRQSVIQALDQIICYYQISEPSSPVPVLAQRAREISQKNFFHLLEDLVPSHKGDLVSLLSALQDNPIAPLLTVSYQRFVAGDMGFQNVEADVADTVNTIQTRQDVQEVLSTIDGYFTRYEPSSPVPLIVAEMRKLIPKRFAELVEEFNRVLSSPAENSTE